MKRSRMIPLLLALCLFNNSARAELDWNNALRYATRLGIAGVAENLKADGSGQDGRGFWKTAADGAWNQLVDDGVGLLQNELSDIASLSDVESAAAINKFRSSIDQNTTRKEYNTLLKRINAEMAQFYSDIADLEYRQSLVEKNTEANTKGLQEIVKIQNERARRFQESLNRIDLSLAEIRGRLKHVEQGLADEEMRRKAADDDIKKLIDQSNDRIDVTNRRVDVAEGRITLLENMISPMTRRRTAARLGASGGIAILRGTDPIEAARVLQLSIAYDRVSNKHAEPGSRYFLAIAYRRMGKQVEADEMVAEAIAAERFRMPERWFDRIIEKLQGSDRQWLQAKISDPRFGVRAPRTVLLSRAN